MAKGSLAYGGIASANDVIYIDSSANQGIGTVSPTATLEVEQSSGGGVIAFKVDNNDTDKVAVSIEAANIDADVMDISADAVTTARVIDITADALTSGSALYIDANSTNCAAPVASIIQNHSSASGSTTLYLQNDHATANALKVIGAVQVGVDNVGHDVTFYGATASAYMRWDEDVDDLILAGAAGLIVPDGKFTLGSTAVSSTAAELNLLDGSSAGSVVNSKGVIYSGTGTIAGTLSTAAQGSVTSLGTLTALTVDDVAINGKVLTMTGSASDTAVFTVATNGTLSIVTTDAAAAAANLQITADGTVDIDSAGVLTLDSGAAINIEPASGSAILLDGTISIDAGVVTGATSITTAGLTVTGAFTSLGIDDNADAVAITIDSSEDVTLTSDLKLSQAGGILYLGRASDAAQIHRIYSDSGSNLKISSDLSSSGSISFVPSSSSGTAILLDSAGKVGIGGVTAPGNLLTILATGAANSSTSGIDIIDADIAHGITDYLPTNACLRIGQLNATEGGGNLIGATDNAGQHAMTFYGLTVASPTATVNNFRFIAAISNGSTALSACPAAKQIFEIRNDATPVMTILGDGKIGINHDTPAQNFDVWRASSNAKMRLVSTTSVTNNSQVWIEFMNNSESGSMGYIGGNGSYSAVFVTWSDERLKENITNLTGQLDLINQLQPRNFKYKIDDEYTVGFIAQEVQPIFPEVVTEQILPEDEIPTLTLDGWSKTDCRLVACIQELSAKNDVLEAKVEALENA